MDAEVHGGFTEALGLQVEGFKGFRGLRVWGFGGLGVEGFGGLGVQGFRGLRGFRIQGV